jgi:transposase
MQITTIRQALVERYGFTGSYDSVRRLLKSHQKSAPVATVFLDHPPAETAQNDFGAGPVITDVRTGEVMKTWFFVMTLPCSKHMYAELVTNQGVETWMGRHRRAFEHFGGTPLKTVIDNPKCAITRACYYEPEVQRAYAEFAERYAFLVSACSPRGPQNKKRFLHFRQLCQFIPDLSSIQRKFKPFKTSKIIFARKARRCSVLSKPVHIISVLACL